MYDIFWQIKSRYLNIRQALWKYPNRLWANRATASMAVVSIPFVAMGKPFFGVTMALGALAGALSDTDDHPKGRVKTLAIMVVSFFISCFMISLLHDNPWWQGTWFFASTVVFILIGGIDERYRRITFGSIQVGIYAMLGMPSTPEWYWTSILLPAGALFHGVLSLGVLIIAPWRVLDIQMARGYRALSRYLLAKSRLFPSEGKDQVMIRNNLAIHNIEMVNSLDKIREVINNYDEEIGGKEQLLPYLRRFMLLQSLHERAASSHEQYEILNADQSSREVLEGFGEMLRQLSFAVKQFAENILIGSAYRHPMVLDWIMTALDAKLKGMDEGHAQPLVLLHHNLSRSHLSLKHLEDEKKGSFIPQLRKDDRSFMQRIKEQLTLNHPRMQYAIRLGICFLVGYVLVETFQMEKGAWVMLTSFFVSQISYSETRRRVFQRVLGTVTGVVVGVLLWLVFPSKAGQIILMLASAWAFFYWVKTKYSYAVLFITIFVLFAFNLITDTGDVTILIPRLVDTLIGAVLAFAVNRFLWPVWQYRKLPEFISKSMRSNALYFEAIIGEYGRETKWGDDFNYRVARRQAHRADNDLALAWRTMQVEPKTKRKFMQYAFTLTYLNHALLSYISALGINRETYDLNFDRSKEVIGKIAQALSEASTLLAQDTFIHPVELSSILNMLREQIVALPFSMKRQQLRLFYNITDLTMKMIGELEKIKKEG